MAEETKEEAVQDIDPADFDLPDTHAVQALEERYIKASVLKEVLDKKWPKNAAMIVRPALYCLFPTSRKAN